MFRYLVALLLAFYGGVAQAQDITITGTVRNLNGTPVAQLQNFRVEAKQGDRVIARGRQVTNEVPFTYEIVISSGAVNPQDVRVVLAYRAQGRDPVDLSFIAGRAVASPGDQVIDVCMPLETLVECAPVCIVPCATSHRKGLFRRR